MTAFPFGGHPTFGEYIAWAVRQGCSVFSIKQERSGWPKSIPGERISLCPQQLLGLIVGSVLNRHSFLLIFENWILGGVPPLNTPCSDRRCLADHRLFLGCPVPTANRKPRRGAERSGWRSAPPRRFGGHHDHRTEDHPRQGRTTGTRQAAWQRQPGLQDDGL